ncbi:MAG: Stp1/IreP family PP2C-type Ser/Thr phosphatase [Deltaproteobacteria bacterium]|nr:Stp1/IreP family PP2C-type Ser/Thr phosphatase [Deltaproteobacteria bacterium]
MSLEFAGVTDVGRKRDHNEDSPLVLPERNLVCVCDGMGGHSAGEVASGIGVETIKRFFEIAEDHNATWPFRYDRNMDEASNKVAVAAQWANQRIREAAAADGGKKHGMGTTFVGVLVTDRRATFGWVGDSRGYLFRRGELHPATSDHSLINELIKTGRLSDEEIANFQHKNIITRALGMGDAVEVDINAFDLEDGDICLVCSDGLTGMVSDERIAEILTQEQGLQAAAQRLIDEANANGGVDNISACLIRFGKAAEASTPPAPPAPDAPPAPSAPDTPPAPPAGA